MKSLLFLCAFLLLISCQSTSNSSTTQKKDATIEEVEKQDYEKVLTQLKIDYQKQLDTGIDMLGTSQRYEHDTDSLLTLIYAYILHTVEDSRKEYFIAEQEIWLKERTFLSKKLWQDVDVIFKKTGVSPELEKMVAHSEIGDFNLNQAIFLNNELHKTSK